MAVCLLAYQVADLCLGKPPLRSISASATVANAIAVLKSSEVNFISVWSCDQRSNKRSPLGECCKCVGKVCMVDIICFLARGENLASPALALKSPVVSVLLPKNTGRVRHVEPSSSLLDAIDLILDEDAQNLVVPLKSNSRRSKPISKSCHNGGQEYCWITQEDIIRFLLSSIALFSPISTLSIATLGIISHQFPIINYDSPAPSAIAAISRSLVDQTSVAIVDDDGGTLIGEISPVALACCDETVTAAMATLSAGELMAYIDCGGPPDEIVRVVEERLKEQGLEGLMEALTMGKYDSNSATSCNNVEATSPTTPLSRSGWYGRSGSYSARMVRRAEAIVCHPGSSMVAVMIQAIAHRVNYVWVIEDDCSVVGIVTFANMLKVFRQNLES